ncbi:hypothetical protein ACFFX0_29760 [Citricoccus parietis]|uniref:Uncharacterized protein n=1 Tax=Citricoccus parietis TaxID=592307 RepID=A0ABV5G884_9MICC
MVSFRRVPYTRGGRSLSTVAPKHATAGSRAHYRPVSAMAPDHTTDGPQRSEYSAN